PVLAHSARPRPADKVFARRHDPPRGEQPGGKHMRTLARATALLVASVLASQLSPSAQAKDAAAYAGAYKRPDHVPFPPDNAYSKARVELGRSLFFDPRLSASDWISCATCHNPALAWGDGLPRGIGHGMKQVGRRTPTVLNLAWSELLF